MIDKLSDYASYELGNIESVPPHVEARIVSGLQALEQQVERLISIKEAVIEYYMIRAASALQGGDNTAGLRPEDIWREYAPQMVADALAAEEKT